MFLLILLKNYLAYYLLKRGSMYLRYNESPAAQGMVTGQQRPINDTDNLDGILFRPGRSDFFISRRLDWSINIELAKSELNFRIFGERREQRVSNDGIPLGDEAFAGVAIRWSWNLGVNTTMGLGGDLSQRDDSIGDDDLRRYYADIAYRFSQRFSLRGEIIHSSQKGRESSQFDYDENQLRLMLRTEF